LRQGELLVEHLHQEALPYPVLQHSHLKRKKKKRRTDFDVS
jgi:hypothetical protein